MLGSAAVPQAEVVRLRVNEIFYSVQGESSHAGRPCVFVRLTGCPLRCTYCDTEYAFHAGDWMHLADILDVVRGYPCRLVQITGGEPLAQSKSTVLMQHLLDAGYEVLLETSGAYSIADVPAAVRKIVDVKTPDSREAHRNLWANLELLQAHDEVKFVIASRHDYEWTREILTRTRLHERAAILLSPEWNSSVRTELAEWLLADGLPVRYQLQLHKLIWPGVERGV